MTEQNDETLASKAEDKTPVEVNEQPSLPPAQSKVKRIFLRILRGFLGMAIVFGLGFLTALFLLYVPARQIIEDYKSAVEQANQQIESLNTEVGKSQEIAQKFQDSQTKLMDEEFLQNVLRARVDVTNAMLALANNDLEKAKTYLSTTKVKLIHLESFVQSDQVKTVTDMQARLELVVNEIETDPYAASSDLDVLSTSLQQLEDTYF
jgi:hypothetical protein